MKNSKFLLILPLALSLAHLQAMEERRMIVASSSSDSSTKLTSGPRAHTLGAHMSPLRSIETIDLTTMTLNDKAFGRVKREILEPDHSNLSTDNAQEVFLKLTALSSNPDIEKNRQWKSQCNQQRRSVFDQLVAAYNDDLTRAGEACAGLAEDLIMEKQLLQSDLSQSLIPIYRLQAKQAALETNQQVSGNVNQQLSDREKIKEARQTIIKQCKKLCKNCKTEIATLREQLSALQEEKATTQDSEKIEQLTGQLLEIAGKIEQATADNKRYQKRKEILARGENPLAPVPTTTVDTQQREAVTSLLSAALEHRRKQYRDSNDNTDNDPIYYAEQLPASNSDDLPAVSSSSSDSHAPSTGQTLSSQAPQVSYKLDTIDLNASLLFLTDCQNAQQRLMQQQELSTQQKQEFDKVNGEIATVKKQIEHLQQKSQELQGVASEIQRKEKDDWNIVAELAKKASTSASEEYDAKIEKYSGQIVQDQSKLTNIDGQLETLLAEQAAKTEPDAELATKISTFVEERKTTADQLAQVSRKKETLQEKYVDSLPAIQQPDQPEATPEPTQPEATKEASTANPPQQPSTLWWLISGGWLRSNPTTPTK